MRGSPERPAAGAVTLALLVLLPGTSRAAGSASLPQLDVHSYASQLFWLAVFFIVVYVFMRFVGIPRVEAIVAQRRAQIGGDIGAAERLRLEAAEARKEYEATLAEAHAAARKLVAETHERNVAILAEQTHRATVEFERRVNDAEQRINAAKDEALAGVPEVARTLTAQITSKLAGQAPATDSVVRAVDRVMAEAA
jgi:F-type H+-transporting ATPase subunit b